MGRAEASRGSKDRSSELNIKDDSGAEETTHLQEEQRNKISQIITQQKMKPSHVALAAAVLMLCVCVLQTSAVPFTQQVEDEHHVESETPAENQHETETSHDQANPLALFRTKRQSHLSLCRFCCNCCRNKGCGYCCRF